MAGLLLGDFFVLFLVFVAVLVVAVLFVFVSARYSNDIVKLVLERLVLLVEVAELVLQVGVLVFVVVNGLSCHSYIPPSGIFDECSPFVLGVVAGVHGLEFLR